MSNLGIFLQEKKSEQENTKQVLEDRKNEFIKEFILLESTVCEWLSEEISSKQIEVFTRQTLGNVYGIPTPIIVKTFLGEVTLNPDIKPLWGALGKITIKFGYKEEVLYLKTAGWVYKDGKPLTKELFTEKLKSLLK